MCRFLAYIGAPIILNRLLYEPQHSLINQSFQAREMDEPLNGDGFGLGWYVPDLGPDPALFTSIQPAWNNRNLRYMAPKISSECVFAHIRAASVGDVTQLNCHPFHYGRYLMMHNGGVDEFEEIKRPLIDKLSAERFDWLQGQTDSEHIFALFLDHLLEGNEDPTPMDITEALEKTFDDLERLKERYGLMDPSYLNLCITDGEQMVGCRYVTDTDMEPLSLHHSEGARYECEDGLCRMEKNAPHHEKSVLIVSEKLTQEEQDWHDVPANHFVLVDRQLNIEFKSI